MLKQDKTRLDKLEKQISARYALVYADFAPTLSDTELERVIAQKRFETGRSQVKPEPDEVMDWQIEVKVCAAFQKVWGSYPKDYRLSVEASERELEMTPDPADTMLDRVKRIAKYLETKHAQAFDETIYQGSSGSAGA